jgi:hypothetical protein
MFSTPNTLNLFHFARPFKLKTIPANRTFHLVRLNVITALGAKYRHFSKAIFTYSIGAITV